MKEGALVNAEARHLYDGIVSLLSKTTPLMRNLTLMLVLIAGTVIGSALEANFGSGVNDRNPAPDTVYYETPSSGVGADIPRTTINWVARALYSETKRLKDFEYVAWVVRNRMKSPHYPGTARAVILQPSQFSAFNNWERRKELEAMRYPETRKTAFRRAYRIARYVLAAPDSLNPLPQTTHFFMPETMKKKYGEARPDWAHTGDLRWATEQTRYYAEVRPPSSASGSRASLSK